MGRFFILQVIPAPRRSGGSREGSARGERVGPSGRSSRTTVGDRRPAQGQASFSRYRASMVRFSVRPSGLPRTCGSRRCQPGVLVQVVDSQQARLDGQSPIGGAYWMRATASFARSAPQLSK